MKGQRDQHADALSCIWRTMTCDDGRGLQIYWDRSRPDPYISWQADFGDYWVFEEALSR